MATKSRENVEVGDTETEIIESTETVTSEDREFLVKNGDKEIVATAWGSDDGINWDEEASKTISPRDEDTLIMGPSHAPRVKLTGRTTESGVASVVDGQLTYSIP